MNISILKRVTDFADLYSAAMKAAGFNQNQLFPRLGHASNGLLSRVLNRTKDDKGNPPQVPMAELDRWLDAVNLTGEQRTVLEEQAIHEFGDQPTKKLLRALIESRAIIESLTTTLNRLKAGPENKR